MTLSTCSIIDLRGDTKSLGGFLSPPRALIADFHDGAAAARIHIAFPGHPLPPNLARDRSLMSNTHLTVKSPAFTGRNPTYVRSPNVFVIRANCAHSPCLPVRAKSRRRRRARETAD